MFAKTNLNGVPCVWVDWNGPFRSGCFVKPNTFGKPRSQKRIWTRFSYLMISHAGFHENKIHRIHGWVFLHLQNASEKAEYFWGVDFHFKFLITVQPKILISKVHIQVKMRACQNLTNAAVRMMTYTNTSLPRHLLARSLGTLTRYLAFHEKCMCSSCGSLRVPVNANFCQLLRVTHSDWFIWELFLTWPFKGRSGTWNVRTSSKNGTGSQSLTSNTEISDPWPLPQDRDGFNGKAFPWWDYHVSPAMGFMGIFLGEPLSTAQSFLNR